MIKTSNNMPNLFSNLSDMLNQSHPLYKLADKIDWDKLEETFILLYLYVVKQKCTTADIVIYSDISLFYSQKFFC